MRAILRTGDRQGILVMRRHSQVICELIEALSTEMEFKIRIDMVELAGQDAFLFLLPEMELPDINWIVNEVNRQLKNKGLNDTIIY